MGFSSSSTMRIEYLFLENNNPKDENRKLKPNELIITFKETKISSVQDILKTLQFESLSKNLHIHTYANIYETVLIGHFLY